MWTKEKWKQELKKSFEREKKHINTLSEQEFEFYSTNKYIEFLEKWILELKMDKEFLEDELNALREQIRDTRYE